MKIVGFCVLILFQNAFCHMPNVYEFCSYVVANQGHVQVPQSSCDASVCRGRPGKKGNDGMRGMKGEQGVCDLKTLKRLEDELRRKTMLIPKSIYCLLESEKNMHDDIMNASSSVTLIREPYLGKLDDVVVLGSGGSWCSSSNRIGEWIQIDLGEDKSVSGVVTQGGKNNKWVTSFKIACIEDDGNSVTFVSEQGNEKIFIGNSDANTKIYNMFPEPITCRRIRIYPQSWNSGICMRLYLLNGNCHGITKYKFAVKSAGFDDGNFVQLKINGVDYRRPEMFPRGHFVMIVNARNLEVKADSFDTYASSKQVKRMIAYLNQAPYGSLVAIAVQDATSKHYIDETALAVMESLGAGSDGCPIKIEVRDSWAFISQKVIPGVQIPQWKRCSHIPRHSGVASVEATMSLGRYYNIDDIPMEI